MRMVGRPDIKKSSWYDGVYSKPIEIWLAYSIKYLPIEKMSNKNVFHPTKR